MPEFVRNNRGIDDGQDLPRDYLEMIYSQIEAEEFRKMVILLYAGEQGAGVVVCGAYTRLKSVTEWLALV